MSVHDIMRGMADENKRKEPSVRGAILDSGSAYHMSGIRSDFLSVSATPNKRISGIDGPVNGGEPVGHTGTFKRNSMGVTFGVWMPNFGNRRLLSTTKLTEDGWSIEFAENGSSAKNVKKNRFHNVDTTGDVPRIQFKIYEPNSSLHGTKIIQCMNVRDMDEDGTREHTPEPPNVENVGNAVENDVWEEIPEYCARGPHNTATPARRQRGRPRRERGEPTPKRKRQRGRPKKTRETTPKTPDDDWEDDTEDDGRKLDEETMIKNAKNVNKRKNASSRHKLPSGKVSSRRGLPRMRINPTLDLHRRIGHLHIEGIDVECPECYATKGSRKYVSKKRPMAYVPKHPLEQLNVDFVGPIGQPPVEVECQNEEDTMKDAKFVFIAICDVSSRVWIRPIEQKDRAPKIIGEIIDEINIKEATYQGQRIVERIRSDNEKILRSKGWSDALKERGVVEMHANPYLPQTNGVVERMVHTMKQSVAASLSGVGPKLWPYACRYFEWTWNRVPRSKYARIPHVKHVSPMEVVVARREARRRERDGLSIYGPQLRPLYSYTDDYGEKKIVNPDEIDGVIEEDDEGQWWSRMSASSVIDEHKKREKGKRLKCYLGKETEEEDCVDYEAALSAEEILKSNFPQIMHRFRRFGCMVFVRKEPATERTTFGAKFWTGVFLGYSDKNAAYLIGIWKWLYGSWKFVAVESESVKFTDVLVREISDLLPGENSVRVTVQEMQKWDENLPETVIEDEDPLPTCAVAENAIQRDDWDAPKAAKISAEGINLMFDNFHWADSDGSTYSDRFDNYSYSRDQILRPDRASICCLTLKGVERVKQFTPLNFVGVSTIVDQDPGLKQPSDISVDTCEPDPPEYFGEITGGRVYAPLTRFVRDVLVGVEDSPDHQELKVRFMGTEGRSQSSRDVLLAEKRNGPQHGRQRSKFPRIFEHVRKAYIERPPSGDMTEEGYPERETSAFLSKGSKKGRGTIGGSRNYRHKVVLKYSPKYVAETRRKNRCANDELEMIPVYRAQVYDYYGQPVRMLEHADKEVVQEVLDVTENLEKEGISYGTDELTWKEMHRVQEILDDEEEQVEQIDVYLSVNAALRSPDAPMWIAAMTKEKAKLEAANTWKEVEKGEIPPGTTPIPVCLLLTKKRDGTFKCRAIVLGNRVHKPDDADHYAPVVSLMALRSMMVEAAHVGDQNQSF